MTSINWSVENTRTVTDLFAEQVSKGNRTNNHLNNVAYDEISRRFKDMTGIELKKLQLKNKWDKLKKDWTIWLKLQKQIGIGWENGTIKQDAEWWKKAKADIPGCRKFQNHAIRNKENLMVMFADITNDGADHWSPANGLLPQNVEPIETVNLDEDPDIAETEVDESPSDTKGKRAGKVMDNKSKKSKTSQVMQDEIKKMSAIAERTQSTLESFTKSKDETISVKAVMDLVLECGVDYGSDEYFIATVLFVRREHRDIFLHMPTPQIRFDWLKRKHNSKYGRS